MPPALKGEARTGEADKRGPMGPKRVFLIVLRQELEDVLGHGAHLAALVDDLDLGARPQVLLVDLGDGVCDRDRIPDKDGPYKPDAIVAHRDGLRPGLLDHERRG